MSRVELSKRGLIGHALVPVGVALFLTFMPLSRDLFDASSQGYIDFSGAYSLGYPIFLKLVGLFSSSLLSVAYVQIWFASIAGFCLCVAVYNVTSSHLLAFFASLAVLANPFFAQTHFVISPDSIFISLSLLMLAFFVLSCHRAGFANLLGFGLSMGLCLAVQPYALAYVPLLLIALPLCARQRQCSFFKALFLPGLACLIIALLEASTYAKLHDGREFRPAASYIFAASVLMDSAQDSPYASKDPRTVIWEKVENDLLGVRDELWRHKAMVDRMGLLSSQINYAASTFALSELQQAGALLEKTVNDIRMDIASSRIIQAPLAYGEIALNGYARLWWSDNALSYPFLVISLLTCLFGLWAWITGHAFNGGFAMAFAASLMVQGQTVLAALSGVGHEMILIFLSPFFAVLIIGLFAGFYNAIFNPLRTDA